MQRHYKPQNQLLPLELMWLLC